ncbi:MAG: DUF4422 domain-containing protein [Lachnospiraceae bacterium]|nr:DUF4422 domain-containing protein [Lachnospiraceae bacterium]
MELVIYGAQGIALGAYEAINNIYPQRTISCFLVSQRGANAEILSGVPVLELEPYANALSCDEKKEVEILIATPENVMPEIEKALDEHGLFCHVRLTSQRWAELMGYHLVSNKEFIPLSALPIGYNKAEVHVFMAKFYKDRQLDSTYHMPEWITPIQVGAALCDERVANILDCDGENISEKNVNYSELTALYWMWKNRLNQKRSTDKNEYFGLIHYRRILELTENDILKLSDNDVDVVLPYPMPYEPNIEVHHERYLAEGDWKALVTAIEELQPAYSERLSEILNQRYLYNYNIMLARKEVLSEYCHWLFPLLERAEELSVPKGCDRHDRYIGYMGETLATLYFMVNKEKLNIVHAGCRFIT